MRYIILALLLIPSPLYAAKGLGALIAGGGVMCDIAKIVIGPIAYTFAIVGVVFLGFSIYTGKFHWSHIFIVMFGVIVLLGPRTLIIDLLPEGTNPDMVHKCLGTATSSPGSSDGAGGSPASGNTQKANATQDYSGGTTPPPPSTPVK